MSDVIKKGKFSHDTGLDAEQPSGQPGRLSRPRHAPRRTILRRKYIPARLARYIAELEEKVGDLSHAHAELARSEARFRTIVDDQVELLCRYDADLNLTFVNAAYSRNHAATPDELVGSNILNLIPREDHERALQHVRTLTPQNPVAVSEHQTLMPDGTRRWFQWTDRAVLDEYGQIIEYQGVGRDISERRRIEEAERQQRHTAEALRLALARETELGELKSRFVSIASHEFRTPLASILAATETLSAYRQNMTDDQIEQRLGKIREQVNHLTGIMDDVLHLARIQARRVQFNPVELDVDALCRDILDEFQNQRDFKHQVVYTSQPDLPIPRLDKRLMRQVITNLISNAIKYSPATEPIRIALNYEAPLLKLEVADKGIGIPEADREHLFEPFHRGQNVGTISGTGLGLAIIWESINVHGGRIEVQSEVGQGTTFVVIIPIVLNRGDNADNSGDRR